MDFKNIIANTTETLLHMAELYLPDDVKSALKSAYESETNETAKMNLSAILKNIELAETNKRPLCQDTGIMIFYVKVGSSFPGISQIRDAIVDGVKSATSKIPLRPNAVDPIAQKNSGDNTGRKIPWINWEITDGDTLEITAFPKGGGSENMSMVGMLTPGLGIKGLKKFVVDTIVRAGGKPCPPTIVGIGIGGGADIAIKVAKQSLLRPLNEPNPDPELAKLEKEIYEALNATGIGPMGLGGKTTVLGVRMDYAMRHPASYPVGVAIQCWAARRATARISPDGKITYITHKEVP